MMAQDQYSELDPNKMPTESELSKLVSNMTWARVNDLSILPPSVLENKLSNKFNSVLLTASGNDQYMCYSITGLRPDENNTVIDEHPFVLLYDKATPSANAWGIIHHGGWEDRTFGIPQYVTDKMLECGLTADFTYKGIPNGTTGELASLTANGMFQGFVHQQNIMWQNNPPDQE